VRAEHSRQGRTYAIRHSLLRRTTFNLTTDVITSLTIRGRRQTDMSTKASSALPGDSLSSRWHPANNCTAPTHRQPASTVGPWILMIPRTNSARVGYIVHVVVGGSHWPDPGDSLSSDEPPSSLTSPYKPAAYDAKLRKSCFASSQRAVIVAYFAPRPSEEPLPSPVSAHGGGRHWSECWVPHPVQSVARRLVPFDERIKRKHSAPAFSNCICRAYTPARAPMAIITEAQQKREAGESGMCRNEADTCHSNVWPGSCDLMQYLQFNSSVTRRFTESFLLLMSGTHSLQMGSTPAVFKSRLKANLFDLAHNTVMNGMNMCCQCL